MKTTVLLILLAIVISIAPLFMVKKQGEGIFGGADDQAKALITTVQPDYKPWFSPIWEPPSGEVASLLFALQAAIGSGVLFYYIGYRKGRSSVETAKPVKDEHASAA